jgi:mono/diheme cytochrome c family protein
MLYGAVILATLAGGAALFVLSGVYDIGADDHHTRATLAMIERLRDRSIEARLGSVPPRHDATPEMIQAGARRYAALCVGCHLAPGVNKSELRTGLYPHPPNLAQEEVQESRRTFWVIKHGIKMSAMPAWGKTLDDADIWELVAVVQKLPSLSTQEYQELNRGNY